MSDFRYSKHAVTRMQQRARKPDDIEFVLEYGTDVEDGVLLSKQDAVKSKKRLRR